MCDFDTPRDLVVRALARVGALVYRFGDQDRTYLPGLAVGHNCLRFEEPVAPTNNGLTAKPAPAVNRTAKRRSPSDLQSRAGRDSLRKVYRSLTGNPPRWARMVTILTYDEHGGFFDHHSPLSIATNPPRRDELSGL